MAYERKGVGQGDEINVARRRLDTRRTRQKIKDLLNGRDGALYFCGIVMALGFLSLIMPLPFFGELLVLITWLFARSFFDFEKRLFDYPYRLPQHSGCNDGSQAVRNGKPQKGNGIFMLGNELPDNSNSFTQRQIWAGNSDLRTHMLVLGTTGSGKAQPLDAKLHTPSGWQRMGDVKIGMLLSMPDGSIAPVVGVFPQGMVDIYKVTFVDGRSTEACGEHLWEIFHKEGAPQLLTTLQLADQLAAYPVDAEGCFSVRLPAPVQKPEAALPVDPYVLGCNSQNQALPALYKAASVSQRQQLLRGLLDTDGRVGLAGEVSYSTTSEQLARDVQELVWSLGGVAFLSVENTAFTLRIRHAQPDCLFSLPQKKSLLREYGDTLKLRVTSVEKIGQKEAQCIVVDHPDHLYITDNYIVTHNTEYLLGLFVNAMVINSGFIMCDGKGDPNLQRNIFRLARRFGREDDLLIINFITSGRDFFEKQYDSVTNNMNIFGNTSSGMLIELLVSLMDDSGGGGDMWKGRAISFVAALTRVLVYLRDMGHINLSADVFIKYFEMGDLFELCFEHEGVYGEKFEVVSMALKTYLKTLPGFQEGKKKKQETKTLEQHGFIVMQLTRIFNDLNFNYGHIFNTRVGEIDFFDVVINNRILITLLPALERAPDTLKMLGKLIVGNIKQMMAGCLGNRVEGLVREIIDSRPTNSPVPTTCVLDEYGYYAVVGFAVAPAQARSLGFFICFSAQDFSSLKKASAEEADATWENTNIRAVGRLTSGAKSETMERIAGAAGEAVVSISSGDESYMGAMGYKYRAQQNVAYDKTNRIDYNDLAQQSDGDFTFIIGKKAGGGKSGGVAVIMGQGFYAATDSPMHMRINTFVPVEAPTETDLPRQKKGILALKQFTESKDVSPDFLTTKLEGSPILSSLAGLMQFCEILSQKGNAISPTDAVCAWLAARSSDNSDALMDALDKKISEVLRGKIQGAPSETPAEKTRREVTPSAPSSEPPSPTVSRSTTLLGAEAVDAAIERDNAYMASLMQQAIANPDAFNEQLDDRDYEAADVGEGGESTPHETLTHDDYSVEKYIDDDDMQMDSYGDGLEPVATSFYSGVKPSMVSLMGGNPHKPLSQYTLAIDAADIEWNTTKRHSIKTAVALNLAANGGQPFSSRNEVFEIESSSEAFQVSLHHETSYIHKPIPKEQDPVAFKEKAKQLNDSLKTIMEKSSFFGGDDEE